MTEMRNPDVSVVMSVYNGAATLDETIESVLSQANCDFEFVVVNDGSTDNSREILDRWVLLDPRQSGVLLVDHAQARV